MYCYIDLYKCNMTQDEKTCLKSAVRLDSAATEGSNHFLIVKAFSLCRLLI